MLLGTLLPAAAAPAAANGATPLKPLLTISFNNYRRVMQSASLALQGAALPEAAKQFEALFNSLMLLPTTDGLDTYAAGQIFILLPDPPDGPPVTAALLPLNDHHGANLITALQRHYRNATHNGGILTFDTPHDVTHEALLLLAVAEGRALLADNHHGLQWLARQLRDRTLPQAAPLKEPLRLTADAPLLGLLLQLYAVMSRQAVPAADTLIPSLDHHLHLTGEFISAFETIDLGLNGGLHDFSATLRFHPASNTPLAQAVATLPAPSQALDALLPESALACNISSLLPLLKVLPPELVTWQEELAANTQLLGLRVAPGMPGWLKLLLPLSNGHYATALTRTAKGHGLCTIQLFEFATPAQAEAARSLLLPLLPASNHNQGPLLPLARRRSQAHEIAGYQIASTTNQASSSYGAALSTAFISLLHLNTVELTRHDRYLAVVRGSAGSIDQLLQPLSGSRHSTTLKRSRQEFDALPPNALLLAAGRIAPTEALRNAINSIPSLADRLSTLPLPGDDLHWRIWRRDHTLYCQLRLPGNEVMAWGRLGNLDRSLLQELLSNFMLDQINRNNRNEQQLLPEHLSHPATTVAPAGRE